MSTVLCMRHSAPKVFFYLSEIIFELVAELYSLALLVTRTRIFCELCEIKLLKYLLIQKARNHVLSVSKTEALFWSVFCFFL